MALVQEFGVPRDDAVAELARPRIANHAALVNRWRDEGQILAVPLGDELLHPGFQFTSEGRPHPTVRSALAELRNDPHVTDWDARSGSPVRPAGSVGGDLSTSSMTNRTLLSRQPAAKSATLRADRRFVSGCRTEGGHRQHVVLAWTAAWTSPTVDVGDFRLGA